ncbi:hypothetical protein [Endozoicomonas lisbonensis]|uniref:Uncharacterized protein n=1 Tax=Endozoicomonas lisbonensis TaxID=3120522 RepID=A0ABV2SMH3_9GAMM
MKTLFRQCLLFLFFSFFHLMVPARSLPQEKINVLKIFNGTIVRPVVEADVSLHHRVERLQKKINALEAQGFSMNSVVNGSVVIDEEKYQALKSVMDDSESLFATLESRLDIPVYGSTTYGRATQPVHSQFTTESA